MTKPIPVRFTQGQRKQISEASRQCDISEQEAIRISVTLGIKRLAKFLGKDDDGLTKNEEEGAA
jgi:hypothetical protein